MKVKKREFACARSLNSHFAGSIKNKSCLRVDES